MEGEPLLWAYQDFYFGFRLTDVFEKIPPHLVQEVDIYSMQDFLQVSGHVIFADMIIKNYVLGQRWNTVH